MSSSIAEILGDLTPGIHFEPKDDQIVELYLLPRVRGQPDLIPGLIVEDDTAANTQPWELFDRHGLPDHDGAQAFFFVHDPKGGVRPDRRCEGGGTWKSQKRQREDLGHEMVVVDGEPVKWSRHNLNFHLSADGSRGWVMHEYTITTQPSLKLCSIAFSGHGQKRKRVPDGYDGEPATQRPRVAEDNSWSSTSTSGTTKTTTAWLDQESGAAHGFQPLADTAEDIAAMVDEMTGDADLYLLHAPMMEPRVDQEPSAATQDEFAKQVPLMDQSFCGVPNIDDTDIVHWEGFDFSFSYDDSSMC